MNLVTDSDQYKLARCSLEVTPYSLKDRIVRLRHLQLTKILLDNTRYQRLTFKPQKGPNIVFHVDGKVEVFGDPGKYQITFEHGPF
jgi:exonuclease VII large subunit